MLRGSDSLSSSTYYAEPCSISRSLPHPSHTCHPFRRCKAAARKETDVRQSKLLYCVRSTLDEFLGDW
ncbi:uncharacterized protein CCOS01_06832 [Colletotrichum costaricense]|uniref:Uncharacterized protein n=1 Tax=Colletotrichum costaricense TaxID=1209916 RepID=A0AAI9YZ89_9PEZI|nr:uncharacterized protein CCOS01_06832 [Colletotrichum costaricense]KAK1528998.1 hypothetical protein CCOS01_06832 [Colletotrichum costaricense]